MTFQKAFQYLLLGLFTYLFIKVAWPFLPSLCFAVVFAVLLYGLQKRFSRRMSEGKSAALLVLLTTLGIVGPVMVLLGLITQEALIFSSEFQNSTFWKTLLEQKEWEVWGYTFSLDQVTQQVSEGLKNVSGTIYSLAKSLGGQVARLGLAFFAFLFLLYYFLRDGERLKPMLHQLLPFEKAKEEKLFARVSEMAKTVVAGTFLSAVVSGILAYIGFWAFQVPAPLIWALLATFLSLIPTIGSLLVYLLAIGIVAFDLGWMPAVGLLVYFIIFELILVQNWLKGRFLEDRLNFHPIFVFFALIGGVEAFGSMGLLYGPFIALVFLSLLEFFKLQRNSAK